MRHRDRRARVPLVLAAGVDVDLGRTEDHGGDLGAGRPHGDHDPADGLGHVVGHVGRAAAATTTRGGSPVERRCRTGGSPVEHQVEGGQGDRADDGHAADGHGHMDGPVGAPGLAELAGAVERVDDPEAAVARHVLESLLGPHVVVGVEPVQLGDQELVGHPIARRPDVARRGGSARSSNRACAGHVGQGRPRHDARRRGPRTSPLSRPSGGRWPIWSARGGSRAAACAGPTRRGTRPSWPRCVRSRATSL